MMDLATTRKFNELWAWYRSARSSQANRARFKRGQVVGRTSRYFHVELVWQRGDNGTDEQANTYEYNIYSDSGNLIEADVLFSESSRHEYKTFELGEVDPATWGVGYYNDEDPKKVVVVTTNERLRLQACENGTEAATITSNTLPVVSSSLLVNPTFHGGFDGSSSVIDLGNPTELRLSGAGTWCAWLRTDDANTNPLGIVGKYQSTGNQKAYIFYMPNAAPGKVRLLVSNDGSATFNVTTTTLVNDGEWHFVVGTYDGSAGSIKVYVDGIFEAETTGLGATLKNSTEDAAIGDWNPSQGNNFAGDMKEVRIYDRALADWEIDKLYRGINVTANLQGYWTLNNTSEDSSDNEITSTPTDIEFRSN